MTLDLTKYGGKAVKVPENYAPQTAVEPSQQSSGGGSLLGSAGKFLYDNVIAAPVRELIARPAIRASQAIAAPIVSLFGNDQQKQNYQNEIGKDVQLPLGLGTVKAQKGFGNGGAKQIVGEGLQTASYLAPGIGAERAILGGAANATRNVIARGAATGATQAGLYGTGQSLAQGDDLATAAKTGLESAAAGGVTGGVISGVPAAARTAKNVTNSLAKFGTSQITGLSPETIKTLIHNPQGVDAAVQEGISRNSLGSKVETALNQRLDELSHTGKEYNQIRNGPDSVEIPQGTVEAVLQKHGLQMELDQKSQQNAVESLTGQNRFGQDVNNRPKIAIRTTANSVPMKPGDIAALESWINQYGGESTLTGNGFLNARKGLSQLAEFGQDPSKSDISNVIAKDLRHLYDTVGKKQIPGLAELDAKFAPEKKLLERVRKDYLNPDGSLKDNALNKIVNLTGKGKDIVLERLKQISPGIEQDINILRSLEDIQVASGQKVGTYVRGGIAGFAFSGGNPIAVVVSAILATPEIAVPIIKNFGKAQKIASPVIEGIITKMRKGQPLGELAKKLISRAIGETVATSNQDKPDAAPAVSNTEEYLKSIGL